MFVTLLGIGAVLGLVSALCTYTHTQRDTLFSDITHIPDQNIYYK